MVDNDYNFSGKSTNDFINNFLRQLTFRLAGKQIKIREEDKFKATVKFSNGNILDLYAAISGIKQSKEIQLVDIVLGYCTQNTAHVKDFDQKRVYFRKIR